MPKILKELIALICVLCIAGGIVLFLVQNLGRSQASYDSFTGYVNKVPIDISSPAYGQVLTLPFSEGSTVTKGQTLATIQVLDPHYKLTVSNGLYQVHGDILSVQSPVNGIVGKVLIAPQSTVEGNLTFMELFSASNTEILILLPQGNSLSNYTAFYASSSLTGPKYPLQVLGQVPADIVSNIQPGTAVYRATCLSTADCQKMIDNETITIFARNKQSKSSFLKIPFFSS